MLSNSFALRGSLPHPPLSNFIGRQREIAEIKRQLATTRLLTLTGIGGCGKTRLAFQTATELLENFEQRIYWVDLSELTFSEPLPRIVATILGENKHLSSSLIDILPHDLRHKNSLLILDNCEHLVTACAQLAEELLFLCPELHVLTTSREALSGVGEIVWPVPSLSLPEPHTIPSLEVLKQCEAIQLFVERALRVRPTFMLTNNNAKTVAQICHRLDGIPLAIELAAARAKMLSVEQIAARLDDICRLLVGNHRMMQPRHQTLRTAIDRSYDLLSERESRLFCRISVFSGCFSLEAAEFICTGENIDEGDVLELLSGLVNKSLVEVKEWRGETLYRLLEMTRQYGQSKLQEVEGTTLWRERHRDWYLKWIEGVEKELWGLQQTEWFDRLEMEHNNLKAALQHTLEQGQGELLARLSGSLWRFWLARGHLDEGRRWLEAALSHISGDTIVRANILHGVGSLVSHQHDFINARILLEESLTLYLKLEKQHDAAYVLYSLGNLAYHQNDNAQTFTFFEKSLELLQNLGDLRGIARLLCAQGRTILRQGEYERAKEICKESLSLSRKLGDAQSLADSLMNLALVVLEGGDYKRTSTLCEESQLLQERLGDKRGKAQTLAIQGHLAFRQGDSIRATRCYRQSLILCHEIGARADTIVSLMGLVETVLAQGDLQKATRLYGIAEAQQETTEICLSIADQNSYKRLGSTIRAQLDETTFTRAFIEGKALPLDQAIANELPTAIITTEKDVQHFTAERAIDKIETQPELRILALGSPQVYRKKHMLTSSDWRYTKACELLFYLLCHRSGTKEQIGVALWPDASSAQLRNSFHPALHYLRRALGQLEWVIYENDLYMFNRQLPYWFDVETFENLVRQARKLQSLAPKQAIHYLKKAVRLYHGDFLQNMFDGSWYQLRQKELQKAYLDALFTLGQLFFSEGQYGKAADIYHRLIAYDSFLETAHRQLMWCYERQGERTQALRHYQSLAKLIHNEFGGTPAPETVTLFERLSNGSTL